MKDYNNTTETINKDKISIDISQNSIIFGISNTNDGYFLDIRKGDFECILAMLTIAEKEDKFNESFSVDGKTMTISKENKIVSIQINSFQIQLTEQELLDILTMLNEAKKCI